MSKFEMKVRNMKTGETLVATLDTFDDAATFLSERPPFMEVLGLLSDVSPVQMQQLKESMRPYDSEEMALKREYDARAAEMARKAYEEDLGRLEALEEEAKADQANADPKRPMNIRWEIDDGMKIVDAHDHREIPEIARKAVMAWVAERNTWVADRGQFVAEAHVTVYPADIPGGDENDRVQRGGTFVPRLKN